MTQKAVKQDLMEACMNRDFTAVVKRDGEWWIGWIEELPGVNCQERSREELRESLRDTQAPAKTRLRMPA